ncbi:hypothetical protein GCM10022217_16070 [Chryseobacterium ginsenosidimutans]|uniref:hypothetical protein n=1 Tax=Chryseobacterium ginsenosidimutans TaxID=687846 RepID=UPI0031D2A759
MQTNDLNVLTGSWNIQDLVNPKLMINNIRMSSYPTSGKFVSKEDFEKLKSLKVPVSKELMIEVRKTVSHYETLGKSRRWIRRYIKRKYNIQEY